MPEANEGLSKTPAFTWDKGVCHVRVEDKKLSLPGSGKNPKEALGDLVYRNQESLGFKIPEEMIL